MLPLAPFDYSKLHETLAKEPTGKRYISDWEKFVAWGKNLPGFGKNPESQDLLLDYLRHKRAQALAGNSLKTLLSQLGIMIKYFYDFEVPPVSHLK